MTLKFFLEHIPQGMELKKFLDYLLTKDSEWDVLVFLSRKGYWLYRLYCKEYKIKIDLKKVILSDRFITKEDVNKKLATFKSIYIIDDTMTTGKSMFEIFKRLKAVNTIKKITPLVCFLSEDCPIRENIKEFAASNEMLVEDFFSNIKCFNRISSSDLGKITYYQNHVFHNELIPYVIDLPFISDLKNNSMIEISLEQFEKLMEPTDNWNVVDYSYIYDEGAVGYAAFLSYSDTLLEKAFGDFAYDYVIRCRYKFLENGNIAVCFIPFAIMCSEDYSRLWQCFEVLYKDSRYFDYLNERKSKYEDYLYVAVYRAVVYACTAYIAKKFIKYTSEKLGLSLCFNMEFMHENAGKEFFDAANWMLNKSEFVEWEKRFVLLAKQQIFSASNPKNTGTSTVIAEVYQECLYNAYDKLIEAKRKKPDMLLSIEELIEIVRQNAGNASDKVIKYYVVSILLQFLDLSITGNKLKLGENNRIIRGFKAGENSEISLPYGNSYFYYAIYEFYQFLSKQYGEESESYFQTFYESFVSGLYNLFMNNQYMDSIITMKEFILLKKYYKEAKERLKEVILNKKVVFENSNMDNLVLIDIQRYIKGFQLN